MNMEKTAAVGGWPPGAKVCAMSSGQYDDPDGDAARILPDDD